MLVYQEKQTRCPDTPRLDWGVVFGQGVFFVPCFHEIGSDHAGTEIL